MKLQTLKLIICKSDQFFTTALRKGLLQGQARIAQSMSLSILSTLRVTFSSSLLLFFPAENSFKLVPQWMLCKVQYIYEIIKIAVATTICCYRYKTPILTHHSS